MARAQHVFLVPGFFGFLNLGELTYFARVTELLEHKLREMGHDAHVRAVSTLPTASLRSRAAKLAEAVDEALGADDVDLHFVGHSSGGLDVRLMVTPQVSLPTPVDVDAIGRRTRTVATVASPHYGSPLASVATGVLGQKILRTLSVLTLYGLRAGSRPLRGVVQLARVLIRLDDMVGLGGSLLDQLYGQVIANFSEEDSESLERFLGHVRGDQALLPQVTPEGMDIFNSATDDRPGVHYGCIVTRARPPSTLGVLTAGLDPIAQVTHALYHLIYRLTSRMPVERTPDLSDEHLEALVSGYGKVPARTANDGIVPTLSQLWGEVLHIARADHLDVMGYYGDDDGAPHHVDWLVTRSGFDRTRFRALWGAVARHISRETAHGA